jgi:hypothetical protein
VIISHLIAHVKILLYRIEVSEIANHLIIQIALLGFNDGHNIEGTNLCYYLAAKV